MKRTLEVLEGGAGKDGEDKKAEVRLVKPEKQKPSLHPQKHRKTVRRRFRQFFTAWGERRREKKKQRKERKRSRMKWWFSLLHRSRKEGDNVDAPPFVPGPKDFLVDQPLEKVTGVVASALTIERRIMEIKDPIAADGKRKNGLFTIDNHFRVPTVLNGKVVDVFCDLDPHFYPKKEDVPPNSVVIIHPIFTNQVGGSIELVEAAQKEKIRRLREEAWGHYYERIKEAIERVRKYQDSEEKDRSLLEDKSFDNCVSDIYVLSIYRSICEIFCAKYRVLYIEGGFNRENFRCPERVAEVFDLMGKIFNDRKITSFFFDIKEIEGLNLQIIEKLESLIRRLEGVHFHGKERVDYWKEVTDFLKEVYSTVRKSQTIFEKWDLIANTTAYEKVPLHTFEVRDCPSLFLEDNSSFVCCDSSGTV